ncbi:hypothetical protein Sjap_015514 [Stephania japonica]|uniref:Uncharacterized protein n=1 Tax=Stephania japonica TaxID=461633 RepID=A0AAP0IL69_9MAGN
MFNDQIGLFTTSSSKIYINLDIPTVNEMTERFSTSVSEIQMLPKTPSKLVSIEEQMIANRLSIEQLLEVDFDNLETITVKGKAVALEDRFGWCYISASPDVVPFPEWIHKLNALGDIRSRAFLQKHQFACKRSPSGGS